MRSHGKVFSLLMSVFFMAATATAAFAQSWINDWEMRVSKIEFPAAGHERRVRRAE